MDGEHRRRSLISGLVGRAQRAVGEERSERSGSPSRRKTTRAPPAGAAGAAVDVASGHVRHFVRLRIGFARLAAGLCGRRGAAAGFLALTIVRSAALAASGTEGCKVA